ncbi:hypothetical protein CCR75_008485 [Bremia lactucae]|uniref:Uncharacterized protein n=1 Tax=Bremia lactucae TaxID=4779 RepID=A0A976NYA6_BRELC|nr:hypothetical protein CCR75_008485 [Bremia lactucae]
MEKFTPLEVAFNRFSGCRYAVHHIAGGNNLWANIVSHQGQPESVGAGPKVAAERVATRSAQSSSELRPLQDGQLDRPRGQTL